MLIRDSSKTHSKKLGIKNRVDLGFKQILVRTVATENAHISFA